MARVTHQDISDISMTHPSQQTVRTFAPRIAPTRVAAAGVTTIVFTPAAESWGPDFLAPKVRTVRWLE